MKTKNTAILIFTALTFTLAACQKAFLDPSLNIDPNNPTKVTSATLLASTEGLMAYNTGGPLSQFCTLLDQQTAGAANQFAAYGSYSLPTSAFDAAWTDVYQYTMGNLVTLRKQADQNGQLYYGGISRVMLAYQMAQTTDLWGDVPYSQAFAGKTSLLTPVFDKQAAIYTSLLSMLDTARSQLSASNGGLIVPGADDFIYKGQPAAWIKAANLLKARLYIHLSKVNPAACQNAINAINAGGLESNADDCTFTFGTNETNANPYYQINEQRAGDMDYGGHFARLLDSLTDPREDRYITNYNMATGTADLGTHFNRADAPVFLLSFAEQNFILAEAQFQTGNRAAAQAAYYNGVKASLSKMEEGLPLSATDGRGNIHNPDSSYQAAAKLYLASNGTLQPGTEMQQIMTQKYIALYLNPEAYSDWRRTGFPGLIPNTNSHIPRRFAYPLQEYQYNGANVPVGVTVYSRVFWDKE